MEASTLVFLSLICFQNVNQKFMSICSYFLIQVFSSSVFLVSIRLIFEIVLFRSLSLIIYNVSLSIKIGLFPFYKWIVNLVYSINWFSIGLLASYQKFIPILILSLKFLHYYILLISIFRLLVRIYYRLGLYSVKLIFSYSILSHRRWNTLILSCINWWFIYFLLYSFIFLVICYFNYFFNIEDISDFNIFNNYSKFVLYIYLLNLISLRGIPPFTGFLFKFLIIDLFYGILFYLYLYLLVLVSLIHFYLYIRVILSRLLLFSGKSKFIFNYNWLNYSKFNLIYFFTFILNIYVLFLGFKIII